MQPKTLLPVLGAALALVVGINFLSETGGPAVSPAETPEHVDVQAKPELVSIDVDEPSRLETVESVNPEPVPTTAPPESEEYTLENIPLGSEVEDWEAWRDPRHPGVYLPHLKQFAHNMETGHRGLTRMWAKHLLVASITVRRENMGDYVQEGNGWPHIGADGRQFRFSQNHRAFYFNEGDEPLWDAFLKDGDLSPENRNLLTEEELAEIQIAYHETVTTILNEWNQ